MKKVFSVLVLCAFFSSILFAASSSSTSNTSNTSNAEPYTKDEFPDWAKYIRRFEIVTLGSLPFTTMTATTVYTAIRWAKNDFDSSYIPNPFAFTSTEAKIDQDEQKIVLFSALGASLLIGAIDISIYIAKKEKAKKANRSVLPDNIKVKNKDEIENENEAKIETKNDADILDKTESSETELPEMTSESINDEPEVEFSVEEKAESR